MSVKRRREDDEIYHKRANLVKRQRTGSRQRLLDFSDEILLRVLGSLPVPSLLCIER